MGALDEGFELTALVFVQALPEDHLSEGKPQFVVVSAGLLTGLQSFGDDGDACLAVEGVAGGFLVEGHRAGHPGWRLSEEAADDGERVSEVPLKGEFLGIKGHDRHPGLVH